jgi:hypothetical protein
MPFIIFAALMWFVAQVPWYISIVGIPGIVSGSLKFIYGFLFDGRPDMDGTPFQTAILQVKRP